jgi:hypothetical protein
MSGLWSRIFGDRRKSEAQWEDDEEEPEVAREWEFEHESVDDRANTGFVDEHLGVPQEPRGD